VYPCIGKNAALNWGKVMNSLVFPDVEKYPEETWEWTIGRDFKDRLAGEGREREGGRG
jgi:hypothetical protein